MTDFSDIINFFYQIEKDVFDVLEKYKMDSGGEYLSAFSKNVADFNFNHVVPIGRTNVRDVITAATDEFNARNREHIVYLTPLCEEYYSEKNSNLQLVSTDAWMLFEGEKTDVKSSDIVVRVVTKKDIDDYKCIFWRFF